MHLTPKFSGAANRQYLSSSSSSSSSSSPHVQAGTQVEHSPKDIETTRDWAQSIQSASLLGKDVTSGSAFHFPFSRPPDPCVNSRGAGRSTSRPRLPPSPSRASRPPQCLPFVAGAPGPGRRNPPFPLPEAFPGSSSPRLAWSHSSLSSASEPPLGEACPTLPTARSSQDESVEPLSSPFSLSPFSLLFFSLVCLPHRSGSSAKQRPCPSGSPMRPACPGWPLSSCSSNICCRNELTRPNFLLGRIR